MTNADLIGIAKGLLVLIVPAIIAAVLVHKGKIK